VAGRARIKTRQRPERKAWAVRNVKALLSLAAKERAFTELRQKLAEGLRSRRKHHGLTQMALAVSLRSSQPRVAKMEAGDPTVSIDLLVRSLLALGVTNRDLAAIITGR
jgi:ribosome-binding protein aMBF1 (putative translation factor)